MQDETNYVKRCTFHFSQGIKRRFETNLKPEITTNSKTFNKDVRRYYICLLSLPMLPIKLIESFILYLIESVSKESFSVSVNLILYNFYKYNIIKFFLLNLFFNDRFFFNILTLLQLTLGKIDEFKIISSKI